MTTEARQLAPSLFEQFKQHPPAMLRLTSNAPDRHVVDGIGEVPADGTSFCTITIEKAGLDGKPLTGVEHNDELFLRATGGVFWIFWALPTAFLGIHGVIHPDRANSSILLETAFIIWRMMR